MRKAQRRANQRLKSAESKLAEGGKEFYDDIFAAIYGYIQDRMNMGISEMNKDEIRSRLKSKKIADDNIDSLISVLEQCEMARFAPMGDVSKKELIDSTRSVIANIEKQV